MRAETPDAFDAWVAGEIDQPRAMKISHALLRLTRVDSKQLLNAVVVDIAVCKTVELLGRWLNEFVATVEPEQADQRLRRSLEDRYVSVRPDLDGISFLSAAVSSVDASAVDQVLTALAAAAAPGDERTVQQRRADALVDVLLGRVSNGCHVAWVDDDEVSSTDGEGRGGRREGVDSPADEAHLDLDDGGVSGADDAGGTRAAFGNDGGPGSGDAGGDQDTMGSGGDDSADRGGMVSSCGVEWPDDRPGDDWEQPASVFRRDARQDPPVDPDSIDWDAADEPETDIAEPAPPSRGRVVATPCPGDHRPNPVPAVIGVIVSVQSLFGFSNTPGQLMDRSALVPADLIRDMAKQPGTLFQRLLTDERGNLLDVTELGRFPSRKLGLAVDFRDGVCVRPGCHTPASRCDHDHFDPVPDGPTTASNLGAECRSDHRAKTHAGHGITRVDQHTTRWTTPTGHEYLNQIPPLPVENWWEHVSSRPRTHPNPTVE